MAGGLILVTGGSGQLAHALDRGATGRAMLRVGRRNPMDARKAASLAFDVMRDAPENFRLLAGLRQAAQKAFQHQIVTEVSGPKKIVADEKFQQGTVNLSIRNPRFRQASMVNFSQVKEEHSFAC